MGVTPSEEEHCKEAVNIYMDQFFWVFVLLQDNYLFFFFPALDLLWDAPLDIEVKASGRNKTHYGLELSPDF